MKERFYQFTRRYYGAFLFALPILTLAFIFRDFFFGENIFSFKDVLTNFLPYFFSESKSSTLINQSILAGFPLLVTISAGWFDPVRQFFFHFFDAVDTYRVLVLSYLLLAYIGTYFFARRLGMRLEAAVLSGVIYLFAGQMMLWSESLIIVVYYAILPLGLLLVDYSVRTQTVWKKGMCSVLMGLMLGVGWLAGHVQWLIYTYLMVGGYWLYLALRANRQTEALAREAVWFGLVLLLSATVGFPQIWAILNFLPLTVRSVMPFGAVFDYSYFPQHLLLYLIPSFSIPFAIPYVPFPQSFQNYIGIIPLLIVLFGIFHFKRFRRVPHLIFFASVFLFCFLTSIEYSPIATLMHYLPVFRELRETVRVMFIGDFALALCIGLIVQHLWLQRAAGVHESPRFYLILKRLFLWLLVPVITLFTLIKLFFIARIERKVDAYFLTHRYPHTTGGLPIEHYFSLIHTWIEQMITQLSVLNPEVLSIILFGILGYVLLHTLERQKSAVFWATLLCGVSLNFAVVYAGYLHGISKQELLTPPSTAMFIKSQEASSTAPFRIASPLSGLPFYTESVRCNIPDIGNWNMDEQTVLLHKELLDPNLFLYYDLDSLDAFETYATIQMENLTSYLGSSTNEDNPYSIGTQLNTLDDKMALVLARENVYKAFNIKYFIALVPLNYPGVKKVYTASVGTCKSPVYVYSLGNPWPRYFLTNTISTISPTATFLDWMDVINKAPRPTVILQEKSALRQPGALMTPVTPKLTTDGMVFTTNNSQDTYLFVGNAWLPGYRASIDGVDVHILEVNYAMMAVFVPAGTHTIELKYTATPPTLLTFLRQLF